MSHLAKRMADYLGNQQHFSVSLRFLGQIENREGRDV